MLIADRIRDIVKLNDSSHKLAFSFSIGVFIGISPFLGFHTLLGVILSWLFRLNTFATISGIYLLPFWSLLPLYAFSTWIGTELLDAHHLFTDFLLSFLFGSLVIGSLLAISCYIFIYTIMKKNIAKNKAKYFS